MDNFRLITLSTTCFISFLVFWITFMVTAVWDFCWSFEEFWFETYLPATPYIWFIALFTLVAIWWLSELIIVVANKALKLFNISMLTITFVFILAMTAIFYNFSVYYGWKNGIDQKESLLFYKQENFIEREFFPLLLLNKDGAPTEKPNFDYNHWLEFRDSKTCDIGKDFNSLNKDEWEKLNTEYNLLIRSEYEKRGLDYDNPFKYSREK